MGWWRTKFHSSRIRETRKICCFCRSQLPPPYPGNERELEKLTGYSTMVQHFPDPIHVSAHFGLAFALSSDGICSILVLLGLATRPAAALILIDLLTAFFFVHHAAFFSQSHVELVALYIAVSRRYSLPVLDISVSMLSSSSVDNLGVSEESFPFAVQHGIKAEPLVRGIHVVTGDVWPAENRLGLAQLNAEPPSFRS